jgi:L-threonylcarbamoyladenylate synthase
MIKISLKKLLEMTKDTFSGKTIAFITDTVWGVGTLVDNNVLEGINKIYSFKKRDLNKPLAVLVSSIDEALAHVEINNEHIYDLVKLWPGALTLIFKKSDCYYDEVTGVDTIGIRIPNSHVAKKILEHLGPIATTSINISGEDSLNSIEDIENQFSDSIDYLVTDTHELSKTSSTVVDVSCSVIKIIRSGDIKINV